MSDSTGGVLRDVCVIGGSRYFGKRLMLRLRDEGVNVTVINRGSSPAPPGVTHLVADRDDEAALEAALGDRHFDVVIDQVCYTPRQAAIAKRVFRDRTTRYVMTSTMEVYDPATFDGSPHPHRPVGEGAVDPGTWPVDLELPWGEEAFREQLGDARHYAEGKRQAEAVFSQDPAFAFVSVRSAHVLGGGAEEFTGRLDHYVDRVRTGRPVVVHAEEHPSTFIHDREIAEFLFWAAGADFTGPVNANSHGELSATELSELVAAQLGSERPTFTRTGSRAGDDVSPFSFDRYYAMDNSRATELGFPFSTTSEWLPGAIAETGVQE
ncbi:MULTISPECIES: NAD-dependent epimerase/dehydratase family protein [unclassified Streptomyces]|uniref:NAD-dependent epimerase/dehydratase family protein n=1 Tax=unclassified Streptomyces TaxID=2593676 RepID=UPI001EF3410E|nr:MULTISPECIES: NAD-dependent epimerase/dehydratase family protein [unclassified Streptomyces]MCZ4102882.1 NAD-dependent epimerase/dehydratase family protein [Streptomyces sp. H39-C1]